MDPLLRLLLLGPKSPYDADAQAYFAAMPTELTTAEKSAVDTFIRGLKTDSLWTLIDGGNILCLGTAAQCYRDFKVPSRVATVYGTPTFTFTANRGFAGDANTDTTNIPASISTSFIPSSAGGNMTQDSAHFATYRIMSGTTSARSFAGTSGGGHTLYMSPRYAGDVMVGRVNNNTSDNYLTGVTTGTGFFLLSRTGAAVSFGQQNATQGSTITRASTGLPTSAIRYLQLAASSADLTTSQIAFGSYGGGLTPAEGLLLNTHVQTLVTTLRAL